MRSLPRPTSWSQELSYLFFSFCFGLTMTSLAMIFLAFLMAAVFGISAVFASFGDYAVVVAGGGVEVEVVHFWRLFNLVFEVGPFPHQLMSFTCWHCTFTWSVIRSGPPRSTAHFQTFQVQSLVFSVSLSSTTHSAFSCCFCFCLWMYLPNKVRSKKKTILFGNFSQHGGGVFPNPKTFVNLPSIFLYAKFILRC